MAGTRAKALAKMQAAYGLETLLSCNVCRQRSDCSWFRPSSPRSCGAEVWNTTRRRSVQSQDVSGRKESSHASNPASRDCSSDVLWGHWATSTSVLIVANCVGSTNLRTWRRDGPRRRCDSHSRVAVVSAGLKVNTDWCSNVKSITERIQHTLNQGDCTDKVNQRGGSATPQSHITRRRT
jgi:hypothetical protein